MNSLHPSLREASSSTTTTSMTSISNQKVIDSVRNGVDAQVMSSETAAAGSNAISMTNTTTTTTTHGSEQSDDDNKASENSDVDGHGSNVSATTVESVNSPHAEFSRTSSPIAPDFYHPVSTSKSPLANKYNTTSSSPSAFHVAESKLDQARQQVTPPQVKLLVSM